MDINENLSRQEIEFNMNWAKVNPVLFTDYVQYFLEKFSDEDTWEISFERRKAHTMILIAKRREV